MPSLGLSRRSGRGSALITRLTGAVEGDFVAVCFKAFGEMTSEMTTRRFDIEHLLAGTTVEVMVVIQGIALISNWLIRQVHFAEPLSLDQPVHRTIDGSHS